jgi:hypothetical protein
MINLTFQERGEKAFFLPSKTGCFSVKTFVQKQDGIFCSKELETDPETGHSSEGTTIGKRVLKLLFAILFSRFQKKM